MKWRNAALSLLATCFFQHIVTAQADEPIHLTNPSFEDYARPGKAPSGWYDCGFPAETPPDVQPDPTFSVNKPAVDGNTYLGMVVRDNDTWESVSQRLSRPLEKGQCYDFSLQLSRSELYISVSRVNGVEANYATPAKVRIYGGFGYCDKQYLLAESKLIINTRWLEYNFKFEPIANYSYLIIEVFYNTPTLFPYNGNVLVDNASPITPVPCDGPVPEDPVVDVEPAPVQPKPTPPAPKPQPQEPVVAKKNPVPPPAELPKEMDKTVDPLVDEEVTIGDTKFKRSEMREGQTIRIDKLFFEANKANITEESFETLEEVYDFLDKNDDVVVEIGGHTNNLPPADICDQLSLDRAQAVAAYLVKRGISSSRLQTQGYGKRKPIASNESISGRRQNQRVEIKILGFRKG